MSELDTVFEEEIVDVVQSANVIFKANNLYEGLVNEFTNALPKVTSYIEPDTDEDLIQKKYVDDNFAHLTNNNNFGGIHEVNNILLRGSSNTHILKIDFKYPVVYDINTDYNDIVMSSIASDVTRQGALIIKQFSYRDVEFKNILDETIAKVPIENGSPVAPTDIVTLQFCDQRYRDPVSNVNNTADIDKPISSAMQTALDLKSDISYVNTQVANIVNSAPGTEIVPNAVPPSRTKMCKPSRGIAFIRRFAPAPVIGMPASLIAKAVIASGISSGNCLKNVSGFSGKRMSA
jgi:hypothetical protein